jgi:hypothetical protein
VHRAHRGQTAQARRRPTFETRQEMRQDLASERQTPDCEGLCHSRTHRIKATHGGVDSGLITVERRRRHTRTQARTHAQRTSMVDPGSVWVCVCVCARACACGGACACMRVCARVRSVRACACSCVGHNAPQLRRSAPSQSVREEQTLCGCAACESAQTNTQRLIDQ